MKQTKQPVLNAALLKERIARIRVDLERLIDEVHAHVGYDELLADLRDPAVLTPLTELLFERKFEFGPSSGLAVALAALPDLSNEEASWCLAPSAAQQEEHARRKAARDRPRAPKAE
jgi:hypothetical protein